MWNTRSGRVLYRVPDVMTLLSLSRTVIYELIRSSRLRPSSRAGATDPRRGHRRVCRAPRTRKRGAPVDASRRRRGDGGIHWDEKRQRFIASVTVGYTPAGKRIVRRGSGKTEAQARAKLKEVLRDHEDGLAIAPRNHTVAHAVKDWLAYGLQRPGAANGRQVRTSAGPTSSRLWAHASCASSPPPTSTGGWRRRPRP